MTTVSWRINPTVFLPHRHPQVVQKMRAQRVGEDASESVRVDGGEQRGGGGPCGTSDPTPGPVYSARREETGEEEEKDDEEEVA